jgi:uncharacterized protein YkwD
MQIKINNKINKRIIIAVFLFEFIVIPNLLFSQQIERNYIIGELVVNSKDEINPDEFHNEIIEEIIFDEINTILNKRGFDKKQKSDFLKEVAESQAIHMSETGLANVEREGKDKKTTIDRLKFYGGSGIGAELVSKSSIRSGKILYTYAKVADDIVFKWFASSKKSKLLQSLEYTQIGISAKIDAQKRKVYVSVVFGNFKSLNEGTKYISNLKISYTQKTYGLHHADKVFCKKVYRYNKLPELQDRLTVEGNTIYFETNNIKIIKKLIGKKKDGLAVDIIQKDQFACAYPNIVDHSLVNTGILTKRVYSKKLFKNNIADIETNDKAFKVQLGILPEDLDNEYELNLVIIKNKSVCSIVPESFIIQTTGTYTRNIKLLADTVTVNSEFNYKPVADSMELSFKIPFENKKYEYKAEDIEPFLKLLNEPAFLIYDLKITAYSSIEGSDKENKILQYKRAQSIVKALSNRQTQIMDTQIITTYNWEDFKHDVKKTQHNILASMTMKEAQEYIRNYKLNKELEPILKNHRYAKINMKVTYDISGENEQPYVIRKFNNTIIAEDRILALSIEKYIMKQVLNYRYKPDVFQELAIPEKKQYAGMLMNKYWILYFTKLMTKKDFAVKVEELSELNPKNEYIAFNDLFLKVTQPKINITDVSIIQTRINQLYYTPLRKKTVDGLNIKYQFKLINYADSVGNAKLKAECIDRIKSIVDIREETLPNSLKLAELFIENTDYLFAIKTLEPWIYHPNANETLFYTYISLCSRYEMRMHTQKFNYAMQRAQELNPKRYCDLFDGNHFSLKVFENSIIKESYCKHCSEHEKVAQE